MWIELDKSMSGCKAPVCLRGFVFLSYGELLCKKAHSLKTHLFVVSRDYDAIKMQRAFMIIHMAGKRGSPKERKEAGKWKEAG